MAPTYFLCSQRKLGKEMTGASSSWDLIDKKHNAPDNSALLN
jgi:hypothetical protein